MKQEKFKNKALYIIIIVLLIVATYQQVEINKLKEISGNWMGMYWDKQEEVISLEWELERYTETSLHRTPIEIEEEVKRLNDEGDYK